MSERPRQFIGFYLDHDDLAKRLGIPADHRVVRVDFTDKAEPPAVMVIVEGPGGILHNRFGKVQFTDLDEWLKEGREATSEHAMKMLGPYEWPTPHLSTAPPDERGFAP